MTQVVNNYWDYPTLFIPYSLSIAVFEREIGRLIENVNKYAERYNKHRDSIKRFVTINFTEIAHNYVPLWYICNCGAKVRLLKENGTLKGSCENCGMKLALDTEEINIYSMKLTPQAVSRHLIFFGCLKPAVYISGWGAMPFTLVAKGIAEDFNIHFPPIIPFRINEKYDGIGQLKPILELERRGLSASEIEKEIERLASIANKQREEGRHKEYRKLKQELRDLKAIKNARDCYPSILDYLVNFGIRKTRDNWEEFIKAHDFWDEATISCLSKEVKNVKK